MKNKIIIFLSFIFFANITFAQYDDHEYSDDEETPKFEGVKEEKDKIDLSKFRVGGDLGFGFYTNTLYAEISPVIGYQIIKDRLEIGPGIVYQHQSETNRYAMNNIGGQAYIRGYIFDGVYAQLDGFLVNYNLEYLSSKRKTSLTYGNGFIGAGYSFNHKDAPFYMSISVKTNLIVDNIYQKRLIIPKIGFQIKL